MYREIHINITYIIEKILLLRPFASYSLLLW